MATTPDMSFSVIPGVHFCNSQFSLKVIYLFIYLFFLLSEFDSQFWE